MKPLLRNRLQPPRIPQAFVKRAALIDRLSRSTEHRLTVLTAPAGYGKTTVLASWLAHIEDPVAWLTLHEDDNDSIRFCRYLIAALQRQWQTLGVRAQLLIDSSPRIQVETLYAELLNEIAILPTSIVLVLDDYHLIHAAEIHNGLQFLLTHAPPNFHLIISSRTAPPLPIARLRAKGALLEINQQACSFSTTETVEYLQRVMATTFSRDECVALGQATAGWVTGLQLAVLAGRASAGNPSTAPIASGEHPFIAQYLWDELLQHQPTSVRTFLYQTSLLETFTVALCAAVTQQETASALLTHVEQQNLFLTRVESEQGWFQYHPLFRDYLQAEAQKLDRPIREQLYLRAASWFADAGYFERAIHYGLLAAAHDWVAAQIAAVADQLWTHSEMRLLLAWTEQLPLASLQRRPKVMLLRGWAAAILHEPPIVAQSIQAAEAVIYGDTTVAQANNEQSSNRGTEAELAGILAILQSIKLQAQDRVAAAARYRWALAQLPAHLATWHAAAQIGLGMIQHAIGEFGAAKQAFAAAGQACLAVGNRYGAIYTQYQFGQVCLDQGLLTDAKTAFALAIAWASDTQAVDSDAAPLSPATSGNPVSPIVAWPELGMGAVHYEQNDLDQASDHLLRAVQQARVIGEVEIIVRGYLLLAQIKGVLQQWSDAESLLQRAQRAAHHTTGRNAAGLLTQTVIAQIRLALWRNRTESAALRLADLDHAPHEDWADMACLVRAQACLQRGHLRDATAHLDEIADRLSKEPSTMRMRWGCLRALVALELGNADEALTALSAPLQIAATMGHRRLFLDFGPPMVQLLQSAADHYPPDGELARLCRDLLHAAQQSHSDIPAVGQALIEPLSATEAAILRLLALGLTNQQIADARVVSITTVKWHLKNIYGKLQVHNRTAAVARARELALLQTFP